MNLTVFDVEHGACALLTCDNGTRLMVDCGHNATTGWRPGTYLRRNGVTYLDMLVVTNYDEDHVSGLPDLRAQVKIGWLRRNRTVTPEVIRSLKSEDGMGPGIDALVDMARTYVPSQAGSPGPEFLGVQRESFHLPYPEFDDENNLSLVLYLRVNGIGFLFPGDLETDGWNALLTRNPRFRQVVAQTNVLIASHHGRMNGVCTELFEDHQCNPYWIVISDKGYMHDTQETVPYYASHARGGMFRGEDRKVLTTRNDGAISFSFQDGRWSAR